MRLEWVHESHVINCQNTCKSVITQEWPTDVRGGTIAGLLRILARGIRARFFHAGTN